MGTRAVGDAQAGPLAESGRPQIRPLTYAEAINEALRLELERDPRVFVMGEDVAVLGGVHGHMKGLLERFGPARVRDTPISEAGFIGAASGAAVAGLRPVVELMTVDFFGVAMDQIYNYMPKVRFASAGQRKVPCVLLASTGNPLRQGVTHSQTLHSLFAHLPGLYVVAPATAHDAKGLLISAIRSDDPVIYMFHRGLLPTRGLPGEADTEDVPEAAYEVPFGAARVCRQGSDVTIVTVSFMVHEVMRCIPVLEAEGIDAEVIDLRTLVPLDRRAVVKSVKKTGRLVVVDEDYQSFGLTGEIIATAVEGAYGQLQGPPIRVARADTPIPYSRVLEDAVAPTPAKIVGAVLRSVGQNHNGAAVRTTPRSHREGEKANE